MPLIALTKTVPMRWIQPVEIAEPPAVFLSLRWNNDSTKGYRQNLHQDHIIRQGFEDVFASTLVELQESIQFTLAFSDVSILLSRRRDVVRVIPVQLLKIARKQSSV